MRGFGPPVPVTAPSSWPWIDHSVSGLHPATSRPIKTRFPYASPTRLSSLLNVSRWPIIQKVRSHTTKMLPLYVCIRFQVLFHSPPGFFSPFPHGTGSLSVDDEYLALEDGPPIFRQDFTCPALLFVYLVPSLRFQIRGYHPLWRKFPIPSSISTTIIYRLFRVRSPLLAESRLISFPLGT